MNRTTPHPVPSRRRSAATVMMAAAVLCGAATACSNGATATSDDATVSIAPLPRDDGTIPTVNPADIPPTTPAESGTEKTADADSTETSGASTTTAGSDIPAAARVGSARPHRPVDRGAKEISEAPTMDSTHTPVDESYLTALTHAGITITGVETQLVGTGQEYCRAHAARQPEVTVHAVAGQLVAQQRTHADAAATADAIMKAATEAYCPAP